MLKEEIILILMDWLIAVIILLEQNLRFWQAKMDMILEMMKFPLDLVINQ